MGSVDYFGSVLNEFHRVLSAYIYQTIYIMHMRICLAVITISLIVVPWKLSGNFI